MPLHNAIKQLYMDENYTLYFNRFLEYILTKRYKKIFLYAFDRSISFLVTGELVENNTGNIYTSLTELYETVSGTVDKYDKIEILKRLYIFKNCSVWRILCSLSESDIIEFFDIKYRSYLMYHDLVRRTNSSESSHIHLFFYNTRCDLTIDGLTSSELNIYKLWHLLYAYETGKGPVIQYSINGGAYVAV